MEGFEPPDGNATPFYIGLKLSQFGFYLTDFSPIVQLWHTANICGACATMSLRAMPTALDCILLYQHVKDLGGCRFATPVHSYIPYGVSGLLLLWGRMESNHRSRPSLTCQLHHFTGLSPPVEKVADCRSWLPGKS